MKPVLPAAVSPQHRANLIYAQARAELSNRLWQAALGTGSSGEGERASATALRDGGDTRLDTLLAMLTEDMTRGTPKTAVPAEPPKVAVDPDARRGDGEGQEPRAHDDIEPPAGASSAGLGVNAGYRPALEAAAQRTGIAAPALAAIINAEAAKGQDGRWLAYSRNPRSSAAGLGQFLSSTWRGEAERPGSWLNQLASARGWLDGRGRVRAEAKSELLALRYNGEASIHATADYARANLDALARAGVRIDGGAERTAQMAYLGHHLGVGDAAKFLKEGLSAGRAQTLLTAQVGGQQARRRIAEAGNAVTAHRQWLLAYVDRNIRPDRFTESQRG